MMKSIISWLSNISEWDVYIYNILIYWALCYWFWGWISEFASSNGYIYPVYIHVAFVFMASISTHIFIYLIFSFIWDKIRTYTE